MSSLPISIKGVVVENGKIWLRKNPRNEWELPGGRLEKGEQPEQTVVRELQEELGFATEVVKIVHSGVLAIETGEGIKEVFVVSYLCRLMEKIGAFEEMGEDGAAEFRSFSALELESLNVPSVYREAIRRVHAQ